MQDHLETLQRELARGQAQLLDVREQEEWDQGHLSVAKLVTLSSLMQGECPEDLDKNKKTYLHCRSGNRVYRAAPILGDFGFKDIVPLDEGYDELVGEGFEEADA